MAKHECPSICSRRYMGSFRWWMQGWIASSWIHVICLDNTSFPRGVTRFAWWQQDLHAIELLRAHIGEGQWLGCWIIDGLCALPVTSWTGIHGFGYFFPLIQIVPFSAHKLIRQDTAVLHQAIIV
jgi:hypothetical protein